MVKCSELDYVSMIDFSYNWRINDERWDKLPEAIIERIHPLNSALAEEISKNSLMFKCPPYFDESMGYIITHQFSITWENKKELDEIKERFSKSSIPDNENIYVTWRNGVSFVTEWRIFVDYWDSFWYPFDYICVFDDTYSWAFLLCPFEKAFLIEKDN